MSQQPIPLVFASHNRYKVREIQQIIGSHYRILSLDDLKFHSEIEENASTLEGNALIKARTIHDRYNMNVFADDTGLEVYSLGMQPGVYSARYAGEEKNDQNNIQKLLHDLLPHENRKARFRTAIALILDGKEYLFEGTVEGHIAHEPIGEEGFGYDPVFIPENQELSFAQMSSAEKNSMSHRARALANMTHHLHQKYGGA